MHLNELDRAMQLCMLFEEAKSQLKEQQSGAQVKSTSKQTRAAMEENLAELAFWIEIYRKHFSRVMATGAKIDDDHALQITILLHLRFIKLAITYVQDRVGPSKIGALTTSELLQQPQYSRAKLVLILSDQKKTNLLNILGYTNSKCNQ